MIKMTFKSIEGGLLMLEVLREGDFKNLDMEREVAITNYELKQNIEKLLSKRKDKAAAMEKIKSIFAKYNAAIPE